jgi:hypothetical protein
VNSSHATWIRFEHDRTALVASADFEVVVPVGAGAIAETLFRHDPPMPGEIERAIDAVEDALASTGLMHTERGDLQTAEPRVLDLLGLRVGDVRRTREQVETQFQSLASMALGQPAARGAAAPSGEGAATLLILRECMHHLGYKGIDRATV